MPSEGESRPNIISIVVVLPLPVVPTNPTFSFLEISIFISLSISTFVPEYLKLIFSNFIEFLRLIFFRFILFLKG